MEYEDGNYIKDRTVCPYLIGNIFDDMENKNTEKYKTELVEWKKQLVGDRSFWQICRDKIQEFEDNKKDSAAYIDEMYKKYVTCTDILQKEWLMWTIGNERKRQDIINKKLRYWHYQYSVAKGMKQKEKLNIEAAKSVPIGTILPIKFGERKSVAGREFFPCPLHSEKTASFCWYKKENKWWCFGESKGGDVIDLFMALNNCDFQSAVQALANY